MNRQGMKFEVIESKLGKIQGCIEGENFNEILLKIAEEYDVERSILKAFCRRNEEEHVCFAVFAESDELLTMQPYEKKGDFAC